MRVSFRQWFPVVITAIGLASATTQADKGPAVADVLKIGADYLVQYSQKIATVAGEEMYVQTDVSSGQMGTPKRLTCDFVLYGSASGMIAGFRDVVAIDTQPVRQRDDRLVQIFKRQAADFGQQARQLTDEAIRYYLSPNLQALDQPTIALEFLRKENQERSTFKVDGVKTMNGAQVAILKFTERSTPPLIPSSENGMAVGKLWIDVATGAVRQSEIGITTRTSSIRVSVKYAEQPALNLWLPVEMYQQFEWSGQGSGGMNNMGSGGGYNARQSLEGRATYSKYRSVGSGTGTN